MKLLITPQAEKQYAKIPRKDQSKIQKKLVAIKNDPYIGKKLGGELSGRRSARAWPYRIIYFIDENTSDVYITSIQHRQGAYKQ